MGCVWDDTGELFGFRMINSNAVWWKIAMVRLKVSISYDETPT